jgi:hypothetical protein
LGVAGRPGTNCKKRLSISTSIDRGRAGYTPLEWTLSYGVLYKDGSSQGLSALYTFQKLAERHLKGCCQSRQVAKTDLARTSFEVRYMNLMNTRLFGEVDLPPTPFFSELPDSFAKVCAHIRGHSSSIDLVEALYLVDALSRDIRFEDGSMVPVSRIASACRGGRQHDGGGWDVSPNRKSYESFNHVR